MRLALLVALFERKGTLFSLIMPLFFVKSE